MHDEREMDRVLEIEGVELVGINNRNLGTTACVIFYTWRRKNIKKKLDN